ncbi:SLOG family protein [Allofustis seminis]|uniref:SLOG family protein n=1 Tax=Allofustis seminis TaxID=166939 RepID=UPI00037A0FAA|nr:SLOG family protein [Allofustis seminis]
MKKLLMSGYRSYELQIFSEQDIKLKYLKAYLKNELKRLIEEGWGWFICSGQLGVEQWSAEVVNDLKMEYPHIKLAIFLPYMDFGHNWNEDHQQKLQLLLHQADYVNYTSKHPYTSPTQLSANQQFLIHHTDGLLFIYDEEYPGKAKYLKQTIERMNLEREYSIMQTHLSELELFVADHPHLFSQKPNSDF